MGRRDVRFDPSYVSATDMRPEARCHMTTDLSSIAASMEQVLKDPGSRTATAAKLWWESFGEGQDGNRWQLKDMGKAALAVLVDEKGCQLMGDANKVRRGQPSGMAEAICQAANRVAPTDPHYPSAQILLGMVEFTHSQAGRAATAFGRALDAATPETVEPKLFHRIATLKSAAHASGGSFAQALSMLRKATELLEKHEPDAKLRNATYREYCRLQASCFLSLGKADEQRRMLWEGLGAADGEPLPEAELSRFGNERVHYCKSLYSAAAAEYEHEAGAAVSLERARAYWRRAQALEKDLGKGNGDKNVDFMLFATKLMCQEARDKREEKEAKGNLRASRPDTEAQRAESVAGPTQKKKRKNKKKKKQGSGEQADKDGDDDNEDKVDDNEVGMKTPGSAVRPMATPSSERLCAVGDAVEIFGLEGDAGRKYNQERALVLRWHPSIEGKFVVRLTNAEKNEIGIWPKNLRIVSSKGQAQKELQSLAEDAAKMRRDGGFFAGDEVIIENLVKRPELNGKHAIVRQRISSATGRYKVEILPGSVERDEKQRAKDEFRRTQAKKGDPSADRPKLNMDQLCTDLSARIEANLQKRRARFSEVASGKDDGSLLVSNEPDLRQEAQATMADFLASLMAGNEDLFQEAARKGAFGCHRKNAEDLDLADLELSLKNLKLDGQAGAGRASAAYPGLTVDILPKNVRRAPFACKGKCAICLDRLEEAVTMACGHSFCGECIESLSDELAGGVGAPDGSPESVCLICRPEHAEADSASSGDGLSSDVDTRLALVTATRRQKRMAAWHDKLSAVHESLTQELAQGDPLVEAALRANLREMERQKAEVLEAAKADLQSRRMHGPSSAAKVFEAYREDMGLGGVSEEWADQRVREDERYRKAMTDAAKEEYESRRKAYEEKIALAALARGESGRSMEQVVHLHSCYMDKDGSLDPVIQRACNVQLNKADPYGDGDQSPLTIIPGSPGSDLEMYWSSGGNFNPFQRPDAYSPLLKACAFGDAAEVKALLEELLPTVSDAERAFHKRRLEETRSGGSPMQLTEAEKEMDLVAIVEKLKVRKMVLELRESTLRYSPLFACVAGARVVWDPKELKMWPEQLRGSHIPDHLECARLLIEAGANPNARDIVGHSVLTQALNNIGTPGTLEIAKLLIEQGGADWKVRNRLGSPVMATAALYGSKHVITEALKLNIDAEQLTNKMNLGAMGPMLSSKMADMDMNIRKQAQMNGCQEIVRLLDERRRLGLQKFRERHAGHMAEWKGQLQRELEAERKRLGPMEVFQHAGVLGGVAEGLEGLIGKGMGKGMMEEDGDDEVGGDADPMQLLNALAGKGRGKGGGMNPAELLAGMGGKGGMKGGCPQQ